MEHLVSNQYPDLDPSGSVPAPRHPYFNLDDPDQGLEDADRMLYEDVRSGDDDASVQYGLDNSENETDVSSDQGFPYETLAKLDANTERVDTDFRPHSKSSPNVSEASSSDIDVPEDTDDQSQGEGRRGSLRGRGRGRGRGRARGFGLGPGSRGGIVRTRGERGSKRVPRGEGQRGGRRGRRGPRATAEPSREFKASQAKATTAFLERSFDEALEHAKEAVQINPEIFAAHSLMSQIYWEMGKKEESLGVLWSGAHTKREAGVWWEVANRTSELPSDNKEATNEQLLYCYSQILTLDHNDYEARDGKLNAHLALGQTSRAIRECLAMLKIRPGELDVLQTLADLCIKNRDPARAKQAYDDAVEHYKSVQIDGNGGEFSFSDLNIYLELFAELKDWEGGLSTLKSVSRWLCGRRDETYWDNWTEDDREWDVEDEPRRSAVFEFKAGAHTTDSYGDGLPPEIRAKLGLFRMRLGLDHFSEAMSHFELFDPADQGPDAPGMDYPDLLREIGDALYDANHALEALRFYEPLKKTELNSDVTLRMNMGHCYQKTSQIDSAIDCYKTVLEDKPRDIKAMTELAKLYEKSGEPEKARTYVNRVIKFGKDIADKSSKPIIQATTRQRRPAVAAPVVVESIGAPMEADEMSQSPVQEETPRKKRGPYQKRAKDAKGERKERRVLVDREKISSLYETMQELYPLMTSGDAEAEVGWFENAENLLDEFKAFKLFFPASMYIRFLGYSTEARKRALKGKPGEPLTELEIMADRLEHALEPEDDIFDDSETIPNEFAGVLFTEWLEVFCEYAFRKAQLGDEAVAYETLTTATSVNVFYHNEEAILHIHVCFIACALMLNDEERLCNTARWFIKQYPFATDTFRLFAALNRLYQGTSNWYNSGPSQKFFLRWIKSMDISLLSEEQTGRFKYSLAERTAASMVAPTNPNSQPPANPANPHNLQTVDPALLTLYGHILATAASYPSALNYYFRAYAADPHNALVVFSIALAYLQYARKRQAEDRHYLALQGMAFFDEYRKLRLGLDGGDKTVLDAYALRQRKMETEFNEGRMWHLLGLLHLAVPAYERCLAVGDAACPSNDDGGDVTMTGTGNNGGGASDEYAQHGRREPDFKREAAFALQMVFVLGGDTESARRVTEKWLVY